ncbi:hypothetical protein BHM03_00031674 [Ensete ventricosum]|nr:hypothetical protein BHM03_00031674 [Ensete ventricosum]
MAAAEKQVTEMSVEVEWLKATLSNPGSIVKITSWRLTPPTCVYFRVVSSRYSQVGEAFESLARQCMSKGARREVMGPHYRVPVGLGGCPVRVKPPIVLLGRSVIMASATASVEGYEG